MTDAPFGIDVKETLGELKDGLKWAASFAGAPAELRGRGRLERAAAKALATLLKSLERLAENLLTALAMTLGPAPAPPPPPPAGLLTRLAATRRKPALAEDDSRKWRGVGLAGVLPDARGRLAPANDQRRRRRRPIASCTHEAPEGMPTGALARRFEALIRIAEAPRRYARRFLRLNAARAARARKKPSRGLVAQRPAWLKPKLPPPRIRWIDTG